MLSKFPGLGNLPQIPEEMKTISVTLRHFLILSHAVPASRVRDLVPPQFALDTIKVNGETCAIAQTCVMFNDNLHYTPLPKPALDFWSANFRILTRAPLREDTVGAAAPGARMNRSDAGAWVVRSFLGARAAWAVQRAVAADAQYADFNVITRGDYNAFFIDIVPEDAGMTTQIAVRASAAQNPSPPFASWDKMTEFLTRRPNGYYDMTAIAGKENMGILTLENPPLQPRSAEVIPVGGEVRESKLGVWEKLAVLGAGEMRQPFSILIQPEVAVVIQPPKLLRADAVSAAPPTRQQFAS
ncbi:MAG TPA: hypothetical protein VF681_00545 [Abditibacteriaceae bacterium]|jgi:hypothetical protein